MNTPFNPRMHTRLCINQFLSLTDWPPVSPALKDNMARALNFFQDRVPHDVLWQQESSPWLLRINGQGYKIISWMQAIDFRGLVNPDRIVPKGAPLHSYRDPSEKMGAIRGNWFTFPSTDPDMLAIYPHQMRLHKFKARDAFVCMQSAVSDAYCGWLPDMPPRYRHGGGQQLFIPQPRLVLEPL